MDTLTVKVWKLDFSQFHSTNTKIVALAVARLSYSSGLCWARQKIIAVDTGVSVKTVQRCLQDLEDAGWAKRVGQKRKDGGRGTDKIWLTLPEVVLKQDTVNDDPYGDEEELEVAESQNSEADDEDSEQSVAHTPARASGVGGRDGDVGTRESLRLRDEVKESPLTPKGGVGAIPESEIQKAVSLIWDRSSDMGRQRSSKGDITDGLKAALRRGNTLEAVLRGLGAYFASPDATKDGGAFQRGIHRILAKDRWKDFADSAPPSDQMRNELFSPPGGDGPPKPNEALQRAWMMSWRSGVGWNEGRGPAPGRMGCLVTPAIEREFGSVPYVDAMAESQRNAKTLTPSKADILGQERTVAGRLGAPQPSPTGDADEDPAAFD